MEPDPGRPRTVVWRRGEGDDGWSVRADGRSLTAGAALLLLALGAAVLLVGTGDYPMTPPEVLRTWPAAAPGSSSSW